jgi:hypothetical protein
MSMEKNKIFGLFDFMTRSGKTTFVNDFSGWGEAAHIPGFPSFSSPEGNGIRSEATGAEFDPQYESIRRGDHLEVQYRDEGKLIERVTLGDLFPKGTPVVIVTGSEALRRVCPLFKRRSEMMDWMHMVAEYTMLRAATSDPVPYYWEGNMLELARYLYENRPDKVADRSIYDKCVL